MKLIGFGDGSYVSKKDNQRKEGYRFYFVEARDNVEGFACEAVWCQKVVGDAFLQSFESPTLCLDGDYQVIYNRFGSVTGFQPMSVPAGSRK